MTLTFTKHPPYHFQYMQIVALLLQIRSIFDRMDGESRYGESNPVIALFVDSLTTRSGYFLARI
ncbi:hypothetical protein HMPREF3213_01246 [Heyndrickxia coagulans]|uniref:Uncharacterized protein n=1 Tax=Heyndrickxia coagulans TaxID=1398 RepID=A0A133KVV1_HEYCO|nr:hypothetical protein HMPREF3213_01246 [Heyndrickxia coagulans]